jgi:hypothetical protein
MNKTGIDGQLFPLVDEAEKLHRLKEEEKRKRWRRTPLLWQGLPRAAAGVPPRRFLTTQ